MTQPFEGCNGEFLGINSQEDHSPLGIHHDFSQMDRMVLGFSEDSDYFLDLLLNLFQFRIAILGASFIFRHTQIYHLNLVRYMYSISYPYPIQHVLSPVLNVPSISYPDFHRPWMTPDSWSGGVGGLVAGFHGSLKFGRVNDSYPTW